MRWHRPAFVVILVLGAMVFAHQVALAVLPPYKQVMPKWLGGMSGQVDITVTATPLNPGFVGPPLDFTATYVSDNVVRLDWTEGVHSTNTTIRVKMTDYPTNLTDGLLVFRGPGTTTNDTALSWDIILGSAYYRAWSENATGGYSDDYASATLENPHVTVIADFFPILVLAALTGLLCALAYWRDDMWLYVTGGLGAIFLGFDAIELNTGVGMVIIIFGVYTIVRAFMAWRGHRVIDD